MHTYIHIYVHTYTNHTYTHTCMYICIHTCIHAYIYLCIHTYIRTRTQSDAHKSFKAAIKYKIHGFSPPQWLRCLFGSTPQLDTTVYTIEAHYQKHQLCFKNINSASTLPVGVHAAGYLDREPPWYSESPGYPGCPVLRPGSGKYSGYPGCPVLRPGSGRYSGCPGFRWRLQLRITSARMYNLRDN